MTDETQTEKTPEQLAAEAAAAQGAGAQDPAPEVAKDPNASVDPVAGPADAPEEAEVEFDEPVHNPAALRGIQAGPAPHPRTR